MVLQLAGGARAGVRQLPDGRATGCSSAATRWCSARIRSRRRFRARPRSLRFWNQQAIAPSRYSASLGDWGISARWSPEWLDGTLGFYYPQRDRHPAADGRHPGVRCTCRRPRAPRSAASASRRHAVHHQPERHERRRPHAEGQDRRIQPGVRRQHPHPRHHAVEEHRRRQRRGGVLLPPEHAAAERPGAACCPTPLVRRSAGPIAINSAPGQRHAGRARRHVPRHRQRPWTSSRRRRCSTARRSGRS